MDKSNWRITINKIWKNCSSKCVCLPVTMTQDMGITENDYVKLEYDDEQKRIIITKVR